MGVGFALRGDEAGAFVREEVGDGGIAAWVDDGALVLGGEEGGVPVFGAIGGEPAVVREDDEGGEESVRGMPIFPLVDQESGWVSSWRVPKREPTGMRSKLSTDKMTNWVTRESCSGVIRNLPSGHSRRQ